MENSIFKYCLRLGDNSLILGHRLGEYSSYCPFLEEDLAITNVALDHIGQAETLLNYAGEIEGKGRTADELAYLRPEHEFFNCQLVEQPNTDYAYVMARSFFMDCFNFYLYDELSKSSDKTIGAICAKSFKEVTYHLRRSNEWIIRLGKGTVESKVRIQNAVNDLWKYTGELFEMNSLDAVLIGEGVAADLNEVHELWKDKVDKVLKEATLGYPDSDYMITGSKDGRHSEHLGYILAEMQYLSRTHPEATW